MATDRESLEAALARTPDDLTLHRAYADCLIEDGDPRGEYVRLCLAAEEPDVPRKERKQRSKNADAYRQLHEAGWLGGLAGFLISADESRRLFGSRPRVLLEWRRGWVVGVTCYNLNRDLVRALRGSPLMPFLDSLAVDANINRRWRDLTGRDTPGYDPDPVGAPHPYRFLAEWPPASLKRLVIKDESFGDLGLGYLLPSPAYRHLKSLSLANCHITDEGAEILARHPHTPELESLRLEQNLISPLGIAALAEVGVRVSELQRFGRLEDV